jgi:hypothetical protein
MEYVQAELRVLDCEGVIHAERSIFVYLGRTHRGFSQYDKPATAD